jgi:glycosyltransferase involved in cell wall biosynthesis
LTNSARETGGIRPRLSIVIPCYNGAAELRHCLSSLARFGLPSMECILVDDASSDDSLAVAESVVVESAVAESAPMPIRVIQLERHRGAPIARNTGARAASGDVLVFLDSDVRLHRDTLALILTAFEKDAKLAAIFGAYDDTPSAPGFHSQYRNLLHSYVHRTSRGNACTFWTGCGAVRRDIFFQHGGFDESPGSVDDIEFGGRLARSGLRIELRPEIQVQHGKRWTFFSTIKTDVFLRGVPWTHLILRERRIPNTLNLGYRYRAGVLLVWVALIAAALAIGMTGFRIVPGFVALGSLSVALWLNRKLYRFFSRRHGPVFAAQSAAAHLLHLFNCGLSFLIGAVLFVFHTASTSYPRAAGADLEVADD